ncbi:MAG: hypothetical protein OMM_07694 [Candidatus Magnetoglobus multicellularis str. Araruama]|uniref:Uncharacterized protein n=1 Tax=Candidatus Magnetoglobus multicellularis str. Araruama TaxID=890399 RepID=A0A1V1PB72_9BACT|nr:MAG: hypothetical protein OMM_07694 [Candidatus Magnetoglobus multicellularis str. Araruama]
MGHHDHGVTIYPPIQTKKGILILRKFNNLSIPNIPWKTIDIFTLYTSEVHNNLRYDEFRGDIEGIPGPKYLKSAVAVSDGYLLNIIEIEKILTAIELELTVQKKRFDNMSYVEAEKALSIMFSSDLLNLLNHAGQNLEPWKKKLLDGVIWSQSNFNLEKRSEKCLTDVYFRQLKTTIDKIRRNIKDGETIRYSC